MHRSPLSPLSSTNALCSAVCLILSFNLACNIIYLVIRYQRQVQDTPGDKIQEDVPNKHSYQQNIVLSAFKHSHIHNGSPLLQPFQSFTQSRNLRRHPLLTNYILTSSIQIMVCFAPTFHLHLPSHPSDSRSRKWVGLPIHSLQMFKIFKHSLSNSLYIPDIRITNLLIPNLVY